MRAKDVLQKEHRNSSKFSQLEVVTMTILDCMRSLLSNRRSRTEEPATVSGCYIPELGGCVVPKTWVSFAKKQKLANVGQVAKKVRCWEGEVVRSEILGFDQSCVC